MKVKLLTTISFLTYQLSISQTEKLLHGKVISQNNPLKKVEVINKTAQTSTRTNDLGEFSIKANIKDSLIFFSTDYFFKRLKISAEDLETNPLIIHMVLKPEELSEVVITTIKFPKVTYDPEAIAKINLEKQNENLTRYIPGYKDGTITNGISKTIRLGLGKPKIKSGNQLDFKKLVRSTCPSDFFSKNLKINSEEVDLFLEFCDADPQSKKLLENSNILSTMDFLYAKNKDFMKLKTEPKN